MKILYIASGIRVPGAFGGAIHTSEVAYGLAARGIDMHVVVRPPSGTRRVPWRLHSYQKNGVTWYESDLPKAASLLSYPLIARLIKRIKPDAVMERYYNLAGAGVLAAARHGVPTLLEVNALIVDPPQIRKRQIDDALARFMPQRERGGPLRRWAVWQCNHSAKIVTPLHTTVPPEVDRTRIVELPWGANVSAFQPNEAERAPLLVFLGSFRHWHGVTDFVRAANVLLDQGFDGRFLLIGDGPEREQAQQIAQTHADRFEWAGAVAHDRVPALLARATVGVAPFNPARHPALQSAGFFWSPLKIYEYMAAGLPVVTANIPPLDDVIRPNQEGALFEAGNIQDLARAMRDVAMSPNRAAMGRNARQRVEQRYSWEQHCAELQRVLEAIGDRR
ncbi:MAG: glycosyltransferase family 4 protein [Herpetosiphon sp.]|nr:glycosyltransferase family 4 protein [Herpetosiphon sp.]